MREQIGWQLFLFSHKKSPRLKSVSISLPSFTLSFRTFFTDFTFILALRKLLTDQKCPETYFFIFFIPYKEFWMPIPHKGLGCSSSKVASELVGFGKDSV